MAVVILVIPTLMSGEPEIMRKPFPSLRHSGFAVIALLPAACWSAESPPAEAELDQIYVWGKREAGIGEVTSASEGLVSYGEFTDRPLLRTGEIAEVIPGLAVTQHSGTGKANQYFLRGFNLDHGTDFSVSLNGAPLNLRTNAHGQGYLDLNPLIPELVDSIRYRKGPYYAEVGDFSAAGSADFSLFKRLPEDFATLTLGEHGYGRVLGATTVGEGYVALDLTTSDGPWQRDENLKRGNLVIQQTLANWSLSAIGYAARWDSTDQIPLRAVESGNLSYLGYIDPTDGGKTSRALLSANFDGGDAMQASAYLQFYKLNLWSNFTYFLDDPVHGDQFEQAERRWIAGGKVARHWESGDLRYVAGAETRFDRIGRIGLYRTDDRARLSTDREDRVSQGSGAVFGQAEWHRDAWRASIGLRYDVMGVEIDSDNPANSGTEWDGIASPKGTLVWRASDTVELYANLGRGFHSNDARGALATESPGGDPIDPVQLHVPGVGGELGFRFERSGFTLTAALWALKLDSELVYTGDAGDTESSNASRRLGGELLLNWSPARGINVDFSAATTRARYRGTAAGEDRIPNALDYVITGGVTAAVTSRSTAEVTVRRLGPASLIEDNSVRSGSSTLTNLLYRFNFDRLALFGEVLNVFDRRDHDITYFYTSRLPGEAAGGVDDVHFHPMEPRTFRVGLRYAF